MRFSLASELKIIQMQVDAAQRLRLRVCINTLRCNFPTLGGDESVLTRQIGIEVLELLNDAPIYLLRTGQHHPSAKFGKYSVPMLCASTKATARSSAREGVARLPASTRPEKINVYLYARRAEQTIEL